MHVQQLPTNHRIAVPCRVCLLYCSPAAAGAGDGGLAAGLPGFGGFWSVAKAVQSAVQQTADEVVRSVQTTDWKSELAAFTHEVEAEAQKVSHKAAEVVQHLPAQLHARSSEVGVTATPS
jgi:2C-methyl-D-erythritol 2,4-cyclodiphosphate synthase